MNQKKTENKFPIERLKKVVESWGGATKSFEEFSNNPTVDEKVLLDEINEWYRNGKERHEA
jgi:hypothetical protein